MRDEGRPLDVGSQVQASNHCKPRILILSVADRNLYQGALARELLTRQIPPMLPDEIDDLAHPQPPR